MANVCGVDDVMVVVTFALLHASNQDSADLFQPMTNNTADNDDGVSRRRWVCNVRALIRGLQYHTGAATVTPRQFVGLVRESSNPASRHAIRVVSRRPGGGGDDDDDTTIGHLQTEVAAVLAPLLDRGIISVTARLATARQVQPTARSRSRRRPRDADEIMEEERARREAATAARFSMPVWLAISAIPGRVDAVRLLLWRAELTRLPPPTTRQPPGPPLDIVLPPSVLRLLDDDDGNNNNDSGARQ